MLDDHETFTNVLGQKFYKRTNEPVWPHRKTYNAPSGSTADEAQDFFVRDDYVLFLLTRLSELEMRTRPDGGSSTSKGKDLAAFDALELAGELVKLVAGWAIAHQVGLAVEGRQFVPLQPSGTKDSPDYIKSKNDVDNHEHERIGGRSFEDNDPVFVRKCLANLLRTNSGGWPDWLCRKIFDGLHSLEFGENNPLFSPVKEGRKRDLKVRTLELSAIAMVAFRRRAYRQSKDEALGEVAGILGVSPETVKSWETRLKDKSGFGKLEVDRTISFANNHASYVRDALERQRLGETVKDCAVHEVSYGASALKKLGREYKAALKTKWTSA